MLRVLCAAAVVSLVLGIATEGLEKGWMEGTSILVAVVMIVTVTSGNNWVKEQQFKKLNAIAAKKNVNVFRRGNVDNISVDDLTVGDIQIVETGEIISVEIPASVELTVADTEPGVQGDRVSGARKPATLETGRVIQVPLFVETGDRVKVDTRTGDYMTRV